MPEQSPNQLLTQLPEKSARDIYVHGRTVKRHRDEIAGIIDNKGFKASIKRMGVLALSDNFANTYNNAEARLIDAKEDSKQDFVMNYDYRVHEAITDATAAGVELNLPETGLPEAAVHVVELPQQHQEK